MAAWYGCDRSRMGLWMSWTLEGVGSAGQTVLDVSAAVRALYGSVERSRRAFGSDEQEWQRLRSAADQVGAQVLAEGLKVLKRGQPWSLSVGGVSVLLIPR